MYADFPFILSINVSYGGWLLNPVLEYGASPRWVYPYAPRDIGNCEAIEVVQAPLKGARHWHRYRLSERHRKPPRT